MRYREVVKILKKNGWHVKEIKGSHVQFTHPLHTGKITVPYHSGDVKESIVRSIEKQSGIKLTNNKNGVK